MRSAALGLLALGATGCREDPARLPPPEAITVTIGSAAAATPPERVPVPARTPGPERGAIAWETSEPRATEQARAEGRPLFVYFTAKWCMACVEMEKGPFKDRKVIGAMARFVALQVDATTDESPATDAIKSKYKVVGLPTLIVFDRSGHEHTRITELASAGVLATVLAGVE
jgi:thiol:disulfide interchange protein DsbD